MRPGAPPPKKSSPTHPPASLPTFWRQAHVGLLTTRASQESPKTCDEPRALAVTMTYRSRAS